MYYFTTLLPSDVKELSEILGMYVQTLKIITELGLHPAHDFMASFVCKRHLANEA